MSNNWKKTMLKGYNVAFHGIRNSNGSMDIVEDIIENGLKIPKGRKSIRATTIQMGDKYRNSKFNEEFTSGIKNYQFGLDSEGYVIVVVTPTIIKNSREEMLFLGDPYIGDENQDFATSGQEYQHTCILDYVCEKLGKIPPEFIYGYVEPENRELIKNSKYYLKRSNDINVINNLFNTIKGSLDETVLEISEAIANGNLKKIEFYKELLITYQLTDMLNIIEKAEKQYGFGETYEI